MISRRLLINSLAGAIIAPAFIQKTDARDFSQVSEKEKIFGNISDRYTLLSQDDVKKSERDIIENQILPNQYKVDFWDLPRTLYLKDPITKEEARIVYFENGNLNYNGYRQAIYFLRDKREKLVANHELKLLDLMCALQAWMRVYGSNHPIIITSGYRSPKTNSLIENSAKNSMHIQAKAVDLVVPFMDPKTIGAIAQKFYAGGVGIYLDKKFNHLDTANVRTWTRNKK